MPASAVDLQDADEGRTPKHASRGEAVDAHSIGRAARPALHLWEKLAARAAGRVALLRDQRSMSLQAYCR